MDLVVATPAFLDMTVVGLEGLPALGQETFAGDLLRSPGGGAITAIAASRLGLRTALVAPLGDDGPGELVRSELEREGVAVTGTRTWRTPQTLVMPVREERAMITVDPGARARTEDIAQHDPVAVAANLDQLHLVPDGVRAYVTCGDDDARAFARKLPAAIDRATVLFLDRQDALMLTGASDVDSALSQLADLVGMIVIPRGAHGSVAVIEGERIETADFDTGPVVDNTGDCDLRCAAYAWSQLRGAGPVESLMWAQLYAKLATTVPTATAGAVTSARLLEEGTNRGLAPPALT
jgi:sugar/nucleoside kinase (ribokinase family)